MTEKPLVDFMIIGAQKCGTTSLAEQLKAHPQVRFCDEKEPHFFSKYDSRDDQALARYHSLYAPLGKADGKLFGEASTTYSFMDEYPLTVHKLYEYNQRLKLIYMLRDPVARIESHFNHRLRNGRLKHNDPERAVEEDESFLQRSQYARQLRHYLNVFPLSQIQILLFENYTRNPQAVVKQVLDFIGADTSLTYQVDNNAKNISDARQRLHYIPLANSMIGVLEKMPFSWRLARWLPLKTPVPTSMKMKLFRQLNDDIDELERMTNMDFGIWKDKYQKQPR